MVIKSPEESLHSVLSLDVNGNDAIPVISPPLKRFLELIIDGRPCSEGGTVRPPRGQTERFKISIIIITVFIKEPYPLEKVVFDCVCGAAEG